MAGMTKATLGGKLLFQSDYVAAVEFKGRDVALTIAGVKIEELKMAGGKKDRKPTLSFRETKKRLILNKTNAATIANIYGTKAEDWVGKRITLFPTITSCGAEMVDCVRIRPGPSARKPEASPFNEPDPHEDGDDPNDAFNQSGPVDGRDPQRAYDEQEVIQDSQTASAPTIEQEADQRPVEENTGEAPLTDWEQLLIKLSELAESRGVQIDVKATAIKCLPTAEKKNPNKVSSSTCDNIYQSAVAGRGFWAALALAEAKE